jgi:hypothetical protein
MATLREIGKNGNNVLLKGPEGAIAAVQVKPQRSWKERWRANGSRSSTSRHWQPLSKRKFWKGGDSSLQLFVHCLSTSIASIINFAKEGGNKMKKYFVMMVAILFVFGVAGAGLAQQAAPSGKQDVPAGPIDGKKSEKSEKRQAVTPEKKTAAEAPGISQGQSKPDTKPVKKSEKSKKRQAQTPEKKKAVEAPATGEGMAAPPAKK